VRTTVVEDVNGSQIMHPQQQQLLKDEAVEAAAATVAPATDAAELAADAAKLAPTAPAVEALPPAASEEERKA
jgi:hypothetical protein